MSRSVVLDSNLLLLYIAGLHSTETIGKIKRLQSYTASDFRILQGLLRFARGLIFTPNTLTETSNLLRSGKGSPGTEAAKEQMAALLARHGEMYQPSKAALARPEATPLGLTDAVLLMLADTGAVLITADLDLFLAASHAEYQAINFNHHRDR